MSKCPICPSKLNLTSPICKYCNLQTCMKCRLPEIHGCSGSPDKLTADKIRGYVKNRSPYNI